MEAIKSFVVGLVDGWSKWDVDGIRRIKFLGPKLRNRVMRMDRSREL